MFTMIDKTGKINTVESLKKENRELYNRIKANAEFNGGHIAGYYEIMYNDFNLVIRDIVGGR